MGEQRRGRGGRGRSGRGGRIPRKGEGQAFPASEESFVSFPLEVTGPIRVASPLDESAVGRVIGQTLGRERAHVATLEKLVEGGVDPTLGRLQVEAQRHRDVLEQLARDLEAEVPAAGSGEPGGTVADLLGAARLGQAGWQTLQRAAFMFGDKRIDRVARPVLREKARHLEVLESAAAQEAGRSLVSEMEF